MTRTNANPVALGDRPIMARRVNANALVSIHQNALPDGMNPFQNHGTGTYYFHTHSKRFATLMQRSLVSQLGLRDLGTFHKNLALARPTWMPAVLTEGTFIIMPDEEAALRTPEYQGAYARGVVGGLEKFFATFAQ
jgi:N-acetylmuramoyl-L-alanine amidase